jgi:hypothetical protein
MEEEKDNSKTQVNEGPDTENAPVVLVEKPAAAIPASPKEPMARRVQKGSAWALMISAILFALIAISAIWGVFGDNNNAAWKSVASLGIVALASLVINVGARIFEDHSH